MRDLLKDVNMDEERAADKFAMNTERIMIAAEEAMEKRS
jgi:hypothetical protein